MRIGMQPDTQSGRGEAPPRHEARLSLGDDSILLTADNAGLLDEARAYLAPFYPFAAEPSCGRPLVHVHLSASSAPITRMISDAGPPDDVLFLDYPGLRQRGRRWSVDSQSVYHDEDGHVWYVVDRPNGKIVVAAEEGTGQHAMRLVRLVLYAWYASLGAILLHAAALELDGEAFLLVGPSRAGKTTLLLDLLLSLGGRLMAVDAALVWRGPDELRVLGIAGSLGLGLGTARRFGIFLDEFPGRGDEPDSWKLDQPRTKARIGPERVAAELPMSSDGPMRLSGILLPQLRPDASPEVRRLSPAEAAQQIADNRFSSHTPPDEPDWLRWIDPSPSAEPPGPDDWSDLRVAEVRFGTESPSPQLVEAGILPAVPYRS
jgi:hypothetical protein